MSVCGTGSQLKPLEPKDFLSGCRSVRMHIDAFRRVMSKAGCEIDASQNVGDLRDSLEKQTSFAATLKNVDVIFGHDTETGNVFLAYGKDLIETVIASGEGRSVRIGQIDLKQSTDELEMLLACVQVAKGKHDYEPTADDSVDWLERLFRLDSGTGSPQA